MPTSEQPVIPAEIVAAIRRDLCGLTVQTTNGVRDIRRKYSRALRHESPATIVSVADALFTGGSWPERVVASEILAGRPEAVSQLKPDDIEKWRNGLADWASIDLYGVTVAGVAWRERRISDRTIMTWTKSSDRWTRRLALVATVALNSRARGGSGDAPRTLKVCRALIDDRDDMVVKALSWALRELSKRDRESVEHFLLVENDRLASRVRREVRTKLDTGLKTPRRNQK
jgi:3-methyladenine DNA glycosylase AlkD